MSTKRQVLISFFLRRIDEEKKNHSKNHFIMFLMHKAHSTHSHIFYDYYFISRDADIDD